MKRMKIFPTLVISACVAVSASSAYAAKFSNPDEMITEFSDFYAENNSYELVSKDPVHIRLSAPVVDGDHVDVIREQNQRALVYGIYRSLALTEAQSITVTAVPIEIDFGKNSGKPKFLNDWEVTVTKDRKQALSDINKVMKVKSLDELFKSDNQWNDRFKNSVYYNAAGLNNLVSVILKN